MQDNHYLREELTMFNEKLHKIYQRHRLQIDLAQTDAEYEAIGRSIVTEFTRECPDLVHAYLLRAARPEIEVVIADDDGTILHRGIYILGYPVESEG
jgi:hypothetical protein